MSDKIDREIEEILKRIDESGPRENTPTAQPYPTGLAGPWLPRSF